MDILSKRIPERYVRRREKWDGSKLLVNLDKLESPIEVGSSCAGLVHEYGYFWSTTEIQLVINENLFITKNSVYFIYDKKIQRNIKIDKILNEEENTTE